MPRVAEQTTRVDPKVSVKMLAYNHEKFIGQAIESVLMQETDFPVELVIGEDCSTDGTRQIVKAYAEKYPNVIRALLRERNLGSQRNSITTFEACQGQYVAVLEGDDYWTDPRKLQKQVALMDQNPQYSMCGTAASDIIVMPDGSEREYGGWPNGQTPPVFSLEYVLREYPFRTLTVLFRNGLVKIPAAFERPVHLDVCFFALYAEQGPAAYLNEVTGTYRVHLGGVWSGALASKKIEEHRVTFRILNEYFSGAHAKTLLQRDLLITTGALRAAVGRESWLEVRRVYFNSFRQFILFKPLSYLKLGVWLYAKNYLTVRK